MDYLPEGQKIMTVDTNTNSNCKVWQLHSFNFKSKLLPAHLAKLLAFQSK